MTFKKKLKNIQFNKRLWLLNRENRIYMVNSLIKSGTINSLNKEEVEHLLGFEFNDIYSNVWSYYLGDENFIFRIKRHLYIYFNENGKVDRLLKK